MMEVLRGVSHLDHGMTVEALEFIQRELGDRDGFFIETLELPEEFRTLECALRGPLVGDEPIPESECHYEFRGNRDGKSRVCRRGYLPTRKVTVVAGPHEGHACVLYTAYPGPAAPREPFDKGLDEASLEESKRFWAEHALSHFIL